MQSRPSGVTEDQWDNVRERFKSSMMVSTELIKLAQNVDKPWPLKGREEVPLKYLPLTFEELHMMPGIAEKPERIRLLVDILEETLAFDDPFGDMAEHVDSSSKHDESALKALQHLNIPEDYPMSLCRLSTETRKFCEDEELQTIGQFLMFAQNMAQNVVVGGDFRNMLNAFNHIDEHGIKNYLPTRPGEYGIHLPEALGHRAAELGQEEFVYLLKRFGGEVSKEQESVRELGSAEVDQLTSQLQGYREPLEQWFGEEADKLKEYLAKDPRQTERFFTTLKDEQKEVVAQGVARVAFDLGAGGKKKKGFFARLFGG